MSKGHSKTRSAGEGDKHTDPEDHVEMPSGDWICGVFTAACIVLAATVIYVAGYDDEKRTKPPLIQPQEVAHGDV